MNIDNNPLLASNLNTLSLDFKSLTPEHFTSAFDYLLPLVDIEHENSVTGLITYENLFLNSLFSEQLSSIDHLLHSLIAVTGSEPYRKVQEEYSPKIIEFYMRTCLDIRGYNSVNILKNSDDFSKLTKGQQKTINETLKSFNKRGIHLSDDKKAELTQINLELDTLRQKFEQNITNYIKKSGFYVKIEDLSGLSQRAIESAKVEKDGQVLYFIDENSGLFEDVLTNGHCSVLRQKVYQTQKMKGRHPDFDNTSIISEIHLKKQEYAKILGFNNYSELNLEDNIAKTPLNVSKFLNELGEKATPKAKRDFSIIHNFGVETLNQEVIQPWDFSYLKNKYKQIHLAVDEETMRQYFPIEHVTKKTFEFFSNLFNIEIKEVSHSPLWNEDVKYYEIFENGKIISSFFFDPYARNDKMPGAWVDGIVTRNFENKTVLPVGLMVCNNAKNNTSESESTFTFYELSTFFHEFGHLLHHCLTKINYSTFSGFNNVPTDAIEFPSQFLENFVYQYDVIEFISSHITTKEPLPYNDFQKLYDLKLFMSGLFVVNFVQMAEMDLTLYLQTEKDPIIIEKESKLKWQINPNIDLDNLRMPHFSHIFGGGYESNYYSYQWAEILSLDLLFEFSLSFNNPTKLKKLAQLYKENVLDTGGYNDMESNFIKTVGRKPDMNKYLQFYGIS